MGPLLLGNLTHMADIRITTRQREVIAALIDTGEPIERDCLHPRFFFKRQTGDRPSNFGWQYQAVAAKTVDCLFSKGWLKRTAMHRYAFVSPDGVDVVEMFPELFPEEAAS